MSKEKPQGIGRIIILRRYERVALICMGILLVMLNLGSLYFIVDLMSYDEMVGYLSDGGVKYSDPRNCVCVLGITILLDILFVFTSLCSCWCTMGNTKSNV